MFGQTKRFLLALVVLSVAGCQWPWKPRSTGSASPEASAGQAAQQSKVEKRADAVATELCTAALTMRRLDMMEIEGSSLMSVNSGPEAADRLAKRAASSAQICSESYAKLIKQGRKLPAATLSAKLDAYAFKDRERQALLETLKPVIRRHIANARIGIFQTPEAYLQDLQVQRYRELIKP